MQLVKSFNSTGVAPNGVLYANDLNNIQTAAAAQSDFTQTVGLNVLEIGVSSIQLLKIGTALARITAGLTVDDILTANGGLLGASMTSSQIAALPTGTGVQPTGLIVFNSTAGLYQYNAGTDTAPSWTNLGSITTNSGGQLANIPSATTTAPWSNYFATDQVVPYTLVPGTPNVWTRIGLPAGAVVEWHSSVATPTGWTVYDGSNLPASTGIYAALYAALGNTLTKPDTRGRATYGVGTNTDINAVGQNDSAAVGSRSPLHNHSYTNPSISQPGVNISDPGHAHQMLMLYPTVLVYNASGSADARGNYGVLGDDGSDTDDPYPGWTGTGQNVVGSGTGISAGLTGPPVASGGSVGPGGSRPNNTGGYIGAYKIAKL